MRAGRGVASAPMHRSSVRDPVRPLLAAGAQALGGERDLWECSAIGIAAIWRPGFFDADEQFEPRALVPRMAGIAALGDALARESRRLPECPGLVFALVRGGSCRGVVMTASRRHRAEAELECLWEREMPTGVYDARWLPCRTRAGHGAGARLHARSAQPELHRPVARRRVGRDPARCDTAATAARSTTCSRPRAA